MAHARDPGDRSAARDRGACRGRDQLIRALNIDGVFVTKSVMSSDGSILAVERERDVAVYEVASGKVVFEAKCRGAYAGKILLSADGRILVCDTATAVEIYDVRRKQLVREIEHLYDSSVDTFALSPDGRRLAIGKDIVLVYDLPRAP